MFLLISGGQIHGEEVYRCREICWKPATVFDLLQVSVKPLGYQFERSARDRIALGTQSRKAFGDFGERSKPRRTEKGEKKLELRLGLNCPLTQRRSITINQSFSYVHCFQGASLRTADAFPVVASLPPKNSVAIFRRERSDDRKCVCCSQAIRERA